MSENWPEIEALAVALSDIALVISLLLVLTQLRKQGESQFIEASADAFNQWMRDDFQRAQQWILNELKETSWREFTRVHRNQYGERAFLRVGAYYNRVGYLVTRRLLGGLEDIELELIAGSAIRVWQKLQPLVLEARLIENATLFQEFERLVPECMECYVPGQVPASATSTSVEQHPE